MFGQDLAAPASALRKPLNAAKRTLDILLSFSLLLALAPLLLIIALSVRLTSEGPVIFRHRRVGLGGKEFFIYKFRTMTQNAEKLKDSFTPDQIAEFAANYKLHHDPRVTKLGRILRRTSLDELPQLFNVLRGEMSIVGPRPVTREELAKYGQYTGLLLSVKPGITGQWQVSGRSDVAYEERILLDVSYITYFTISLDLKIILATFRTVITRGGAY
ncbi:putative sugar transferase EpsL [bioreactor metagenome]|uniref:Putative sugar transferase EpsL n=1 Tax=bioreactor metagenome TaxID=1076179 RepID=A0A644WFN9_9ZZZZ